MAEEAGSIYYDVDFDTSKLTTGADRINGALDSVQKGMDRTDASTAKAAKSMGNAAKMTEEEAAALRKLLGQIDPTVAATARLETMQDQLSAAFARGHINAEQYRSNLAKLDAQYKKLEDSQGKAKISADGFGARLTPLATAIAGVISLQALKNLQALSEQFTLLQARIARLSPSIDQARASYQSLLSISGTTGSSIANTVKLWESLTSTLKDFGATNAQALQLTGTLQKIGAIGGSTGDEVARAMRQLQQGLAGGTLRAEEFNSIIENTPELGRQLAKGFGMSMGQLRQAMLDGKLSAQALFDVLLGRTAEVDAEFAKLPRTVAQAGNAFSVAFGDALSKLDQLLGVSRSLSAELDKWADRTRKISGSYTDLDKLNTIARDRVELLRQQKQMEDSFFKNEFRAKEIKDSLAALDVEEKLTRERLKSQQANEPAPAKKAAPDTSTEGQKAITQLAEQNVLLRAQGVERAKLAALQKLGATATDSERAAAVALAVENFNLAEAEKARTASKKKGISEAAKAQREAEAAEKKAAKERQTASDADQKQFAQLGQAIANVGQTAREAAQDAAQLSLSKFATPDEVQRIRDMAGALYDLKGARSALAAADPIAAQQMGFEEELTQLQMLNDQKLLSDQRYLELKHQAEVANAEKMKTLQEENFKAMALGNELLLGGINALAQSGTQALSGLLSGTTSLKDALGGVASTVLNTVIGSFVEMGADWVKQQIMMAASAQATTAAQTGGIAAVTAAQAGATATIAATTTTTAATTGTAVAGSMAPAAGLASIASFGGAAVIGGAALLATMLLAKSFGGGRRMGGPVDGSKMYRVNEGGAPEIFNAANGNQYLMPNTRGQVVSNGDATAGGGGGAQAPIVNVNNYSGQTATATSKFSEADNRYIIDVVVGDMMNGGRTGVATNNITGTRRAGN